MGRPQNLVRLSLKGKNKTTIRVGLSPRADGKWAIYKDGKRSTKTPSANATQIGSLIAKWLRCQA